MRPTALHLAAIAGLFVAGDVFPDTFIVTTVDDAGPGSLRRAIFWSNSNGTPDTILFDSALVGQTIRPERPLPILTEGGLTINGDIDADGAPDVVLSGDVIRGAGIEATSAGNAIRGLVMSGWDVAVWITGPGAAGNQVAACYIGTDLTGTSARPNNVGMWIEDTPPGNMVGGHAPNGNVLSGNTWVAVMCSRTTGATIAGNYIGLDRTGQWRLPNSAGVYVTYSEDCRVGDGTTGGRNVISGSATQATFSSGWPPPPGTWPAPRGLPPVGGVVIERGSGHRIQGNYIGLDASGEKPIGNVGQGIHLDHTSEVKIGGTQPGQRNVISGNGYGVMAAGSSDVRILGNYIGLGADGGRAVPNTSRGIYALGATSMTIGGVSPRARNVIAANQGAEVDLYRGSHISLLGNYIGIDASGLHVVGSGAWVRLADTDRVWIGHTKEGSGNLICGSISLHDGARDTRIMRNRMGLGADGRPLAGGRGAIRAWPGTGPMHVGGASRALGNVLWGRTAEIWLESDDASGTTIRHNVIRGTTWGYSTGIRIAPRDESEYRGVVTDNVIRHVPIGMMIRGAGTRPVVARNRFYNCGVGVYVGQRSTPELGNLGDLRTDNDGGNAFRNMHEYALKVRVAHDLVAEGNDWVTPSAAEIDELIRDQLDNPLWGRVDYDPIIGGISPSGGTLAAAQLTGLTALPTANGADLVFTLSAPAHVSAEVVNIAGRPVGSIPERSLDAGLNRLSWNATSAQGTPLPAGAYLLRVRALDAQGTQSSALAGVQITR
jgi:hypothetical protein